MTKTRKTIAATALALSAFAFAPVASAEPWTPGMCDVYAREVGDDNCDGILMEDESGWDCTTMGNLVCGPGNAQGVPAGDYSGELAWDEGAYVGGWN